MPPPPPAAARLAPLVAAALLSAPAAARPPRDPAEVRAFLEAAAARRPDRARLVTLGQSHEGRPILALSIGEPSRAAGRPALLLAGAHHGGELLSIDFVLDAVTALLDSDDPALRRARDELQIWCVPMVNPDGVRAFLQGSPRTGRKNGRDHDGDGRPGVGEGVDLNRNYPFRWGALGERGSRSQPQSYWYRGPSPASEPEVQAMMRLGASERFVASISYHTGTVALLAPYTTDGPRTPEPDEAWAVAEHIAARMPPHPEGRAFTARRSLYAVDGTAEDHLRHAHGTVALLLEGARKTPETEAARAAVLRAVRPSWQLLLARYLDGPALHGVVRDAAGRPVEAQVSIDEQRLQEGEAWTSRCRDGSFHRLVAAPGRYTLRVRAEGLREVTRVVEVSGRTRVDVTLPGEAQAQARSCPAAP